MVIWQIAPDYWFYYYFLALWIIVIKPNQVNKGFLSGIYTIPKAVYVISQNYE